MDKTDKKVLKKLRKEYEEIKVKPMVNTLFLGNSKCHINALSYAKKHPKKVAYIVGGCQVWSNMIVAHFIIELKDGTYVDPTYGNMTKLFESFLIMRRYEKDEFLPEEGLYKLKRKLYHYLPRRVRDVETVKYF